MRNLLFHDRDNQVWFDYSLDVIFTILLFIEGHNLLAIIFIFLTMFDVVLLTFFPTIEEKWWYKTFTVIIGLAVFIYILYAVVLFLAGPDALKSLNLPLQ